MHPDPTNLNTLVRVPNEIEAAAIVNALEGHGIRAKAVGGYTAGFRAEAPGDVTVIVREADVVRSREVLAEIHVQPREADAEPRSIDASTPRERRPLQFSIFTLLALQTALSVALAIWKGVRTSQVDAAVVFFLATYATLTGAALCLIIGATVQIASSLTRKRQAWVYVGRAVLVALPVLVLLLLFPRILRALNAL